MGDESSYRYRRNGEPSGTPSAASSTQNVANAEDALAELARLIGDDDPFADFGDIAQDPTPRTPPARADAPSRPQFAAPQFSAPPVERRFEDWQPGRRGTRDSVTETPPPAPAYDPPTRRPRPPEPTLPAQANWDAPDYAPQPEAPRATVRQGYGSLARRGDPVPPAQDPDYPGQAPAPLPGGAASRQPAADPNAGYAYSAQSEDPRYAGDGYDDYDDAYDPAYGEEGYMPPHGEEVYDPEPRRRKGRMALIVVASVIGISVAGAAGLFAYRMSGTGSTTASGGEGAPVIKADTTPSKVAGPTPTSGQGSDGQKLIYDRVGGAATSGERMVPREEQPVDVNAAAAAAPPPSSGQPNNSTEPRKVRTVAVRADGTVVPGSAPAPAAAVNGIAPTAYAPGQNPLPVAAPKPTQVTTTATNGSGAAVGTAAGQRPAAPQQPAPSAVATAAAPAVAATGSYVVQVSSQKSEADAMGSWKVLQGRYPQLLGSYSATVRRADLGDRGIYYRAQVGPFGSRDDANNLCNSLRAQGGDCVVTRN